MHKTVSEWYLQKMFICTKSVYRTLHKQKRMSILVCKCQVIILSQDALFYFLFFSFLFFIFKLNWLEMKMHEMWADSWSINYKNYATVRNGNGQSCWKESMHILSGRMKLANILTAKRTQDIVVGLPKCFFWAKSWTKLFVCKLQEAVYENQLE